MGAGSNRMGLGGWRSHLISAGRCWSSRPIVEHAEAESSFALDFFAQNRGWGSQSTTYICPRFRREVHPLVEGGIAQLARALAWHARGPGFESPYLHNNRTVRSRRTVFFWLRSSMDRIRVAGTLDAGSIPAGATLRNPGERLTHRDFC